MKANIRLAVRSLKRNKGRSALTLLGIVIGITAVITVLSTGAAISDFILAEIEGFGSNYIQIEVKVPSVSQTSTENAFSMVGGTVITTLKKSDGEEIAKHPNIARHYSAVMGQEIISYQGEIKKTMLFGVGSEFINIDQSEIDYGRFYTKEENNSLAKVAILGPKVIDRLFGQSDPIGKYVKIKNEKFQVIGVIKERGASLMFDMDNMVILPVSTLQKRILGIDYVSFILAQVHDPDYSEETAIDIEYTLRDLHNISDPDKDDFAVTTMQEAMQMLDTIIIGIQLLLVLLGSISLIVGGVGIMNIMYVSVTERTYEIGLRKSVGATYSNILWQFLWESIIITSLGGLVGIICGGGLTYLVSIIARSQGFDWTFSISWQGMILAVGMSIIVGLIFGLYPARKAALLNPIDALRGE